MKRHGHLYSKIISFENLMLAAQKALRGKKGRVSIASFYFHLESEIIQLQEELSLKHFHPSPYRLFEIREPKIRQICSSDFRDRVVHHAICNQLDPLFEKRLIFDTYACRRHKGTHAATKRVHYFTGLHKYFLKCDIRKYFQSIDHIVLKSLLQRVIKDKQLLDLLDLIIDHAVPESEPGKGIPIGNLTSQYFANFYLSELDHELKDRCGLKGYVRYMDDFICFSNEKEVLQKLLRRIRLFVLDKLKLQLKDQVVRIAPVTEGVPFLGFRIFPNLIRLQRQNLIRFRRKIKKRERLLRRGLISESKLAESVTSMVAHIAHVNSGMIRRKEFENSLRY